MSSTVRGSGPAGTSPAPVAASPAQPAIPSLQESVKTIQDLIMDPQTKSYFDGQTTKLAKEKKEDLWTALAQIGFGMAASKNPYFLGAVGEAGTAAMPAMQQAAAARRAEQNDIAKQQLALHQGAVTAGVQQYQNNQSNALQQQKIAQDLQISNATLQNQWNIAQANNAAELQRAHIAAAAAGQSDPRFFIQQMAAGLVRDGKYKNLNDATPEAVNTFLGILHPPKPGPIPLTPPNATDLSKLPH